MGCLTGGLSSFLAVGEATPRFLVFWASLCSSLLHQSQQERQSIERICWQDGGPILCNAIMEKISHHLYHFPLVRSKPHVPCILKERRLHKGINSRDNWSLTVCHNQVLQNGDILILAFLPCLLAGTLL